MGSRRGPLRPTLARDRDGDFDDSDDLADDDFDDEPTLAEIAKDRPVILCCASGARSASAPRRLSGVGYTNILNAGSLGDTPS